MHPSCEADTVGPLSLRGRNFRLPLAAALALVIAQAGIGTAQASTTVNVNPADPPSESNEFPFGRGDSWPQLGFVYKNIPAFNLKAGDTIAFDLGFQNNVDIQLQISMAATTVNGGDIPGAYTTVVNNTQVPLNPRGNTVTGDYELQFTAEAPFSFPGGGLIIRFSNPGGAYATDLQEDATLLNLAASTDSSGFFVKRFYHDADGLPPYDSSDTFAIGGFRLTIQDNPAATPQALPTQALPKKKKCKKKHKKHSASAAKKKKCKKKKRR
jgi:hypothetical protein